jgi:hypothetical protein
MRVRDSLFRLIAEILFAVLVSQLLACSGVYVVGVSNPSNVTVASGTVSFVSFSVISGPNGTMVNVTAVTLLAPLGSNSLMLCGDQRSSFAMNSNVQVSYTTGQDCSNLLKVAKG